MRCSRPGGAGDRPRPGQGVLVAEVGPELGLARPRRGVVGRRSRTSGRSRAGRRCRGSATARSRWPACRRRAASPGCGRSPRSGPPRGPRRSSRRATAGATIGTGDSPLRPNIACSRSACSVLVGSPVEGPPRWTSMTSSGSSVITARPIVSDFSEMPGPEVVVTPSAPANDGADRGADAGDLVLGLEGGHAERLVLAQLVEDVGGRGDRVGARGRPAGRTARRRRPGRRTARGCR